jgi:hypothetical protein
VRVQRPLISWLASVLWKLEKAVDFNDLILRVIRQDNGETVDRNFLQELTSRMDLSDEVRTAIQVILENVSATGQ